MNKLHKWLLRIVGLLIFAFILSRINLDQAYRILTSVRWPVILGIIIIYTLTSNLIKAYKWQILLKDQEIEMPFSELFTHSYSSFFIGSFTPGRIGEMIWVFAAVEKGHPFLKTAAAAVVDKLEDMVFLLLAGTIFIIAFINIFFRQVIIAWTGIAASIIIAIGLLSNRKVRHPTIKMISKHLIPHGVIKGGFETFMLSLKKTKGKTIAYSLLLTSIIWSLLYITSYLIAMEMSLNLSFVQVAACLAAGSLVSLLPISISGIGTRDAIFILIFVQLGLSSEEAIAFSAAILLIYVVMALEGLIAWIYRPIRIIQNDDRSKS